MGSPARTEPETVRGIAGALICDQFSVGAWIVFLGLVALVAWLLGLDLHRACTSPRFDVTAETPYYNWCERHAGAYPWAVTLLPTGAVAALSALARRTILPSLLIAVVVLAGAAVFDTWQGRLRAYDLVENVVQMSR